jgi:kynureninase
MPRLKTMDLDRWRDEFPILSRTVYMISNSLGAMPRKTAQHLAEYAHTWATRGVRGWEDRWWEMPIEVGNKIAPLIGAPAGSVSMHENVTSAHMVALSCIRPTGGRRRIVCTEMDFPSMIYLYRAQQAAGFDVHVVPAEPDLTVRTDRLLDAIDSSAAVVAFSHVLFRTSYIMDPAPIVARAHEVGAVAILDTYQSAGIIPFDVGKLNVDFATGGCLKWLCGGPGNAFLYTRPDLLGTVQPSFTGWVSHRTPFSFDTRAATEFARGDAMRMMNGTPSIPAYYAALAGLDIIREVGVDRIRDKSRQLTGRLLSLVDRYGFKSAASRDPNRLAGTVAVDVPDAHLVSRTLKSREFIVDYRPPVGVRISPHFYNTTDEIDRIMAEIASIVEKKDYETGEAKSLVT